MKRNYLLPNLFKKIGICMFVPFCSVCLWLVLSGELELDCLSIPVPAISVVELGGLDAVWFEIVKTDPVNEVAMLGLLVSLCFIALSRERDEDEMTGAIRMQSFVWSFWVTAAVLAFGVLFLYDFSFLYFAFAAIYFVFIAYIVKFNLAMRAVRRADR